MITISHILTFFRKINVQYLYFIKKRTQNNEKSYTFLFHKKTKYKKARFPKFVMIRFRTFDDVKDISKKIPEKYA